MTRCTVHSRPVLERAALPSPLKMNSPSRITSRCIGLLYFAMLLRLETGDSTGRAGTGGRGGELGGAWIHLLSGLYVDEQTDACRIPRVGASR